MVISDIITIFKGYIDILSSCSIKFTDKISLSILDIILGFLFVSICLYVFWRVIGDRS